MNLGRTSMKTNKPLIRFLLIFILGYILCTYFFKFWIGLCSPGGIYWKFAEEHLNFIKVYRHFLIYGAGLICNLFDLKYLTNDTAIRIIGHGGIKIVYSCLGYGIISILIALSVAVPYQKLKNRILFLVIAIALFSVLNMIRLFAVSYYAHEARKMAIDHHTLFNFLCYFLILLGMYWWIKRSTNYTNNSSSQNHE